MAKSSALAECHTVAKMDGWMDNGTFGPSLTQIGNTFVIHTQGAYKSGKPG